MSQVEELRERFPWMAKLESDDVASLVLSQPGQELADGDQYVDATSTRRGRVTALEGERVPVGGVYLVKSTIDQGLWDRLGEAIR